MAGIQNEYLQQQIWINANAAVATPGLAGVLVGSMIGVYTNVINPTPTTLLGALTLAVPTSLEPVVVVWSTPFRRFEGGIAVTAAQKTFALTGDEPITLLYGFCIIDTTAAFLLFAENFENGPVQLVDDLSAIKISAQLALGGPDQGTASYSN